MKNTLSANRTRIAHLLGLPRGASKRPAPFKTRPGGPRAAKLASVGAGRAPLGQSKASSPPTSADFSHLMQPAVDVAAEISPAMKARAILAAAAKARRPTGDGVPAPSGVAAAVLAAARKAATPTNCAPPAEDSVAGRILAAGRKRRGEVL
jgi:hypothetical protein